MITIIIMIPRSGIGSTKTNERGRTNEKDTNHNDNDDNNNYLY